MNNQNLLNERYAERGFAANKLAWASQLSRATGNIVIQFGDLHPQNPRLRDIVAKKNE
jgi:hypothetical protein